jgi:predicted nucleotidyltransferase
MNAETEHLRALAERVVQATTSRISVQAALLAGSAGRGNADRFSDLDLLFYVDEVPTDEAIAQVREAVGGIEPLKRHESSEYANGEEFQLDGVRTEVSFTTVERIEWQLGQLLDELEDIASPRQKFLSGLLEGLPVYGEPLIEQWQTRLRDYPEHFRREMIQRRWNFFPLWYYGEAMALRDSELWRLDVLLEGAFNLLGVLAGLNRLYFARFELKRTGDLVTKMALAPPRLADRIESLFRLPPQEAAQSFGAPRRGDAAACTARTTRPRTATYLSAGNSATALATRLTPSSTLRPTVAAKCGTGR